MHTQTHTDTQTHMDTQTHTSVYQKHKKKKWRIHVSDMCLTWRFHMCDHKYNVLMHRYRVSQSCVWYDVSRSCVTQCVSIIGTMCLNHMCDTMCLDHRYSVSQSYVWNDVFMYDMTQSCVMRLVQICTMTRAYITHYSFIHSFMCTCTCTCIEHEQREREKERKRERQGEKERERERESMCVCKTSNLYVWHDLF